MSLCDDISKQTNSSRTIFLPTIHWNPYPSLITRKQTSRGEVSRNNSWKFLQRLPVRNLEKLWSPERSRVTRSNRHLNFLPSKSLFQHWIDHASPGDTAVLGVSYYRLPLDGKLLSIASHYTTLSRGTERNTLRPSADRKTSVPDLWE